MEFRLIYDGWLPPASQNNQRAEDKHNIRRQFSPQLKTLWETHPGLKRIREGVSGSGFLYEMGHLVGYENGAYIIPKQAGVFGSLWGGNVAEEVTVLLPPPCVPTLKRNVRIEVQQGESRTRKKSGNY